MALRKSEIQPTVLPKETHECGPLGGEIVVRGLLLRERLSLFDDVNNGADRFGHLSAVLAACVIDADGKPVFTVDEWERFGAVHFDAALALFKVAQRLSGLDVEERKKN